MELSRYEKFVLLLQVDDLEKARQLCGDDLILRQALLLLTSNYDYKH